MLAIIVLTLICSLIVILCFSVRKRYVFTILLYLTMVAFLLCFAMYVVKTGGFTPQQKSLLLGPKFMQNKLKAVPMGFETMGKLMSFLRCFFCLNFLLSAIVSNYRTKVLFSKHWYLYILTLIPVTAVAIIEYPTVFRLLSSYNYSLQRTLMHICDIILLIYILLSILSYILEIKDIGIPSVRSRHISLTLSMFLLSIVFTFFATLNPVMIYQDYSSIRPKVASLLPLHGYKVHHLWAIVLLCGLASTSIMLIQNWKYYRYTYNHAKEELLIKRGSKIAETTSSVLVHGLKNQIVVAEVLLNEINEELKAVETHEKLEEDVQTLTSLIKTMRFRLNVIYKSFSQVQLSLVHVSTTEILEDAKKKIQHEGSFDYITYNIKDCMIIADKELLSEALYNIIKNAIDAVSKLPEPKVIVDVIEYKTRVMFSIKNNGPKISKEVRKRLFYPFTSTKNSASNWGLGMYYSNQIVKLHFGDIQVNIDNNDMTQFMVVLPKNRIKQ